MSDNSHHARKDSWTTLEPNTPPLTPEGRRRMSLVSIKAGRSRPCGQVPDRGEAVRKWRDRLLAESEAGLQDRSSRPHRSPSRTRASSAPRCCSSAAAMGADHIAHETGLAPSTVQGILNAAGCEGLDRGDRATDTTPVRRYRVNARAN